MLFKLNKFFFIVNFFWKILLNFLFSFFLLDRLLVLVVFEDFDSEDVEERCTVEETYFGSH